MTNQRQIRLTHLRTRQGYDDTKLVIEARGKEVSFDSLSPINPSKLEAAYDAKRGILSLITEYGIFEATGFLTNEGLGTGKRGKRGPRGRNGPNGRDGFEGREGKVGCEGPMGPPGPQGLAGLDAVDGPQGATGIIGCGGEIGPTGFMGPQGETGPQGPNGPVGSSCLIGETGDIGPTPYPYAVISKTRPEDPLAYLWAQPALENNEIPEDPTEILPMIGTIQERVITLNAAPGSFYEGIAAYSLVGFSGGVGPFTYKWTGDFLTDNAINITETGDASTNMNLKCRTSIASGQSVTLTGEVKLTITDIGDNSKQHVAIGKYTFKGTNAQTTNPPGGGGGGCIVYGMRVHLNDTTKMPVENIMHRDTMLGLDIKGLPDSSVNESAFRDWSTSDLEARDVRVAVASAHRSTYTSYYVLNNVLKLTLEEPILAQRDGVWAFIEVRSLVVGDSLYHITGNPVELTSIEIITEKVKVCSFNVEDIDTYFVEGFLIHNRDGQSFIVKK